MSVDPWMWGALVAFVGVLLALDLLVFHRNPHRVSLREAALYSVLWIALGLGFGAFLWLWQGPAVAGEYLAGYLTEKTLSIDNIFVFALVFSYFAVPARLQYRVLFWGVVGAIALRAGFIPAGAALLSSFHVVAYLFGAFLLATGIRIARHRAVEIHPERNPVLRLVRRFVPLTGDYRGERMVVREHGRRAATPLLAALVVVAAFDVVFAVDSIPAVFAITRDAYIVFAANAFSLLGLRALYFLLADSMQRFAYLHVGLGVVLGFVGAKMLVSDVYEVPVGLSLAVIALTIAAAIGASLRRPPAERGPSAPAAPSPTTGASHR